MMRTLLTSILFWTAFTLAAQAQQQLPAVDGSLLTNVNPSIYKGPYTTDQPVACTDQNVYADTSAGPVNLTLPSAVTCDGKIIRFKNVGSSVANLLKLTPGTAGQTVDASPSRTLMINDGLTLQAVSGNWQVITAYYPGTQRLLYSQTTVKAGDTITASTVGTTETNFASSVALPANSLLTGLTQQLVIDGVYTTAGGLGPPTIQFKLKLTSSTAVTKELLATVALTPTNNLTRRAFKIVFDITVASSGTSGTANAAGEFTMGTGDTAASSFLVPAAATPVTVDTTLPQTMTVAVDYGAATAGNSITINQMRLFEARPVKASN